VLVGVVLSLQVHQFDCGEVPGLSVGVIQRGPRQAILSQCGH